MRDFGPTAPAPADILFLVPDSQFRVPVKEDVAGSQKPVAGSAPQTPGYRLRATGYFFPVPGSTGLAEISSLFRVPQFPVPFSREAFSLEISAWRIA
jgi:nucleoid-associated protein YgaU